MDPKMCRRCGKQREPKDFSTVNSKVCRYCKCNFKDWGDCLLKGGVGAQGQFYPKSARCDGEENCFLFQLHTKLFKRKEIDNE